MNRVTKHVDPVTGRAYLFDRSTGASRWEESKSTLPETTEEWVELDDQATGRTFWYVSLHSSCVVRPILLTSAGSFRKIGFATPFKKIIALSRTFLDAIFGERFET